VHPHGAQQNEIEREPEPMHDAQVGEAIIEPADAWIGVPALHLSTHAGGGFGGHHVVVEGGEPGGVAGPDPAPTSRATRSRPRGMNSRSAACTTSAATLS
jgi:hypothetical protein